MPEPGNAMTPVGRKLRSSSLRRKGAALPWAFQSGRQMTWLTPRASAQLAAIFSTPGRRRAAGPCRRTSRGCGRACRAAQNKGGAEWEHGDLIGGQTVAHIGARAAGAEVHRPRGAEREGDHDRSERRVIGMHPDALPRAVLVDDALLGPYPAEQGPEALADHRGPPREGGRGGHDGPMRGRCSRTGTRSAARGG